MFYIFGFYKFRKLKNPSKYKNSFLKFLINNNIKGQYNNFKRGS